MFTFKHITPYGNETLYESDEVTYMPRDIPVPDPDTRMSPSTGQFWYTSQNTGERVDITTGSVYVMNDNGRTIGKYDLGGWAPPRG